MPRKKKMLENKWEILNAIDSGKVKLHNLTDYVSIDAYDKYKSSINLILRRRLDKILEDELKKKPNVMFIFGDGGVGKTTYAKDYAESLGYSYYISSISNDLLDSYGGEDCIILDYLTPNNISPTNLLRAFNNRPYEYGNRNKFYKSTLECKLIIITTTKSLDEFFQYYEDNKRTLAKKLKKVYEKTYGKSFLEIEAFEKRIEEEIEECRSRCNKVIRMERASMYTSFLDEVSGCYASEVKEENPIYKKYPPKSYTQEEIEEIIKGEFGSFLDFSEDNS